MSDQIPPETGSSLGQSFVAGSITHLPEDILGAHVLVGSHGGASVAYLAVSKGVGSLIVHDAGIGLEQAGIEALAILDQAGIPCAAVSHTSARIGDADDMLARGLISNANNVARDLGVVRGLRAVDAHKAFQNHIKRDQVKITIPEDAGTFRRETLPRGDGQIRDIVLLDSASSVSQTDAGQVVVTGSHGGLPAGMKKNAVKAEVYFVAFNDAGIGIDDAGITRLPVLGELGIAAVTVDAMTARIGDARSMYATGIISTCNDPAMKVGANIGQSLQSVIKTCLY